MNLFTRTLLPEWRLGMRRGPDVRIETFRSHLKPV